MSERVKHRVVGALVLTSLMIIFMPAILKKSNRNFEKNIKLALKLPNKPSLPKIDAPSEKEIFNTVNVVKPKKVKVATINKNFLIAKAEPLEIKKLHVKDSSIVSIANFNKDKNYIKVASTTQENLAAIKPAPLKKANSDVLPTSLASNDKPKGVIKVANNTTSEFFSIQVATFTQKNNADMLIAKLKNKGFYAASNIIKKDKGVVLYQVVVGKVSQRGEAVNLQKKLVAMMQLNGFIVKSEVS